VCYEKKGKTCEAVRAGKIINFKSVKERTLNTIEMEKLTTNRGFWLTLLLSIVTLGIYGFYLIYVFARETNIACKDDGKKTQGLVVFLLLTLVTFGIYGIVWQAMLINRRCIFLAKNGKPEGLQLSTYLLTLFLLGWLTLGIMYLVVFCKFLYQQNDVNQVYNEINGLS